MATKPQDSDTDSEIAQRLDRALQRAFKMPPKKHESLKKKPKLATSRKS
jgi:hypothetical protein